MLVLLVFRLFGMDLRHKEDRKSTLNCALAFAFSLYAVLLTITKVASLMWMLINDDLSLDEIVINTLTCTILF